MGEATVADLLAEARKFARAGALDAAVEKLSDAIEIAADAAGVPRAPVDD